MSQLRNVHFLVSQPSFTGPQPISASIQSLASFQLIFIVFFSKLNNVILSWTVIYGVCAQLLHATAFSTLKKLSPLKSSVGERSLGQQLKDRQLVNYKMTICVNPRGFHASKKSWTFCSGLTKYSEFAVCAVPSFCKERDIGREVELRKLRLLAMSLWASAITRGRGRRIPRQGFADWSRLRQVSSEVCLCWH